MQYFVTPHGGAFTVLIDAKIEIVISSKGTNKLKLKLLRVYPDQEIQGNKTQVSRWLNKGTK